MVLSVVEGRLGPGTAVAAAFLVIEALVIRRMVALVAEGERMTGRRRWAAATALAGLCGCSGAAATAGRAGR